jgi:hypothetical protein
MRRVVVAAGSLLLIQWIASDRCLLPGGEFSGQTNSKDLHQAEKELTSTVPVMVDVTHRARPSQDEWNSLHEKGERAGLLGSLADFGSKTIAFMDTRYYTANPAEGTLASYGKMDSSKRYDRYGHIAGVEFSIDENSWKQHYVMNAAALLKLTGSRFIEFAGVTAEAATQDKRQIDVTFVGTTVPKDEAIRRLNADAAALEYLNTVEQKCAAYEKKSTKLFISAPPAPKVVLANVVMLNGNFSKALDASVDGKLHSQIIDDGVELKVTKQNGEEVTLLSPVVRCYRTYSVEFKKGADGRPVMVEILDSNDQPHRVPQVFDLTPDI